MSAVIRARTVDWVAIIQQLRETKTIPQIAEGSGLAKNMIIGMANGYNHPRHANGELIIAFWMRETGKTRDDLPMET